MTIYTTLDSLMTSKNACFEQDKKTRYKHLCFCLNDNAQIHYFQIQVAVKTVSAEKVPSVESVEFLKEAGIMNRLEHEHLCKMYGVVINDIPPSLQLVSENFGSKKRR